MPINKCSICGGVFHCRAKNSFCSTACADRWAESRQFKKFLDDTAKEISKLPERIRDCGKELVGGISHKTKREQGPEGTDVGARCDMNIGERLDNRWKKVTCPNCLASTEEDSKV